MYQTPTGGHLMNFAANQWLDRFHVDASTSCIQFPIGEATEAIPVEKTAFVRFYECALRHSIGGLQGTNKLDRETPMMVGHYWTRRNRFDQKNEAFEAFFEHTSRRSLLLHLPVSRGGPTYLQMVLGVRKRGLEAALENYIQSDQTAVPQSNAQLSVKFDSNALEKVKTQMLGLSRNASLAELAVKLASDFYLSEGYFVPGPESRLRLMLRYTETEHPLIIPLVHEETGLSLDEPVRSEGLKTLSINSMSDTDCYFSLMADVGSKSLAVYCQSPNPDGRQALVQEPMPGKLWQFIREHTGVSLDQPVP